MSDFPRFDVEHEFGQAVSAVGGCRVTDRLGLPPSAPNADFCFESHSVVLELKCLDNDKKNDDINIEKASRLYEEERKKRKPPVLVFGQAEISTAGFSEEFTRQVSDLYRVPIERRARKANEQIAQTARDLGFAHPCGVLVVANNNHTALDPWHAGYIGDQILSNTAYSNINAVLMISGNLAATAPGSNGRIDYWIELIGELPTDFDRGFFTSLRNAWYGRLSQIFGRPYTDHGYSDPRSLASLKST